MFFILDLDEKIKELESKADSEIELKVDSEIKLSSKGIFIFQICKYFSSTDFASDLILFVIE